jgi:hypothetical protein
MFSIVAGPVDPATHREGVLEPADGGCRSREIRERRAHGADRAPVPGAAVTAGRKVEPGRCRGKRAESPRPG